MTATLMISGATGGLGSAFAIECARRGYSLFLTDLRSDGMDFAQFLSEKYGIETRYQPCDLTSLQARNEFFESLASQQLQFWGLINVAGTDYEGAFLERTRSQILNILNLNIEATIDMTQAILRLRTAQKRFMLVNVCSLAAITPMPYKATYAASKRFLLDFSLALNEEISPFGSVTALCPAGLPTTPECMRAIFAQGFWGKMTTVNTDVVARKTLDYALKGKSIYVPGLLNTLLQGLTGLVPASLSAKLVGKRWKSAQESTFPWQPMAHSEISFQQ